MTTIRLGRPLAIGEVTIRPVERRNVTGTAAGPGLTAIASLDPVAIVVRSRAGSVVMSVSGDPVSLEELRREVPDWAGWD